MKKLQAASIALAFVITAGSAFSAYADIYDDLNYVQWQTQQAAETLGDIGNSISVLEGQQQQLLGEIDSLDQQLVTTIAAIDSLNEQIEVKNQEIAVTSANLAVAEENKRVEYAAMKKRIQYLYERGGNAGWATILLEEQDITELLNQAEYTQKMYEYDRNCLEAYAQTVVEVATLKNQYEIEHAELVTMKNEQEEEQAYLEQLLEQKRAESTETGLQLDNAYAMAEEYRAIINELNYQYQQLEAERAAQEAAAAAAAEEAARQAAAQEAAQNDGGGNTDGGGGNNDGGGGGGNDTPAPAPQESYDPPAPSGGGGGASAVAQAVADSAWNYLGCPYVYAGNSLTNGTDCSGFIHLLYGMYGVYTPRSSAGFRSFGTPVSYSEMVPGDVICYDGHVTLYVGNGTIIHASSPEVGIIVGYNPAYRPILTIRRIC